MAYQFERDQLRQEIVTDLGTTQYIRVYPKVPGIGAVAGDSSATYTLLDEAGDTKATGSVNPTDLGDSTGVYEVPVASGLFADLQENCTCKLDWSSGGTTYRAVVLFDVVRHAYANTGFVGLSDLQDREPYIGRYALKIANVVGLSGTDEAKKQAIADRYAYQARVEVDAWVRSAATDLGSTRPAVVLDRVALAKVEVLMALHLIYNGMAGGEGSEERTKALMYLDKAQSAWRVLGPVSLDTNEDLTADGATALGAGLVVTNRRQAE